MQTVQTSDPPPPHLSIGWALPRFHHFALNFSNYFYFGQWRRMLKMEDQWTDCILDHSILRKDQIGYVSLFLRAPSVLARWCNE